MNAYRFSGRDGAELACSESGVGRPLVMLHGFTGTGSHMIEYGQLGKFTAQGYRLVLPDFRGHGQSAKPHDPAAYPPDVLTDDTLALLEHLGLGDGEYDLVGYSLGARIAVRMLARGARPRRAVVAGQGLAKVSGPQGGGANQRVLKALADGVPIDPDSTDAKIAKWLSMIGADPQALLNVLGSMVPTPEDALRRITVPTLVVIGDRDERSDADELAALMQNARFIRVPGDHVGAFAAPEFAIALAEFLAEH